MSRRRDRIVRAGRIASLGLAAFSFGLGTVSRSRPDLLRRTVGYPEGADGFYRRWGAQMWGYAGVQALAALAPRPSTFTAVAALHAVEVGADFAASREPDIGITPLHEAGAASNVALVLLFVTAALRSRRRDDDAE